MAGNDTHTLAAISAALDATLVRQQVASANIANANVSGYVPLSVSFSARIDALGQPGFMGAGKATVEPVLSQVVDANGQAASVRLDDEVARIAQNALHYQALLKGLDRYTALLMTAVTEGKR